MDLSATEINKHSTELHLEAWKGYRKFFSSYGQEFNLTYRDVKVHSSILRIFLIIRELKTKFGPLLRWSSPFALAIHPITPLLHQQPACCQVRGDISIPEELRCQGLYACSSGRLGKTLFKRHAGDVWIS